MKKYSNHCYIHKEFLILLMKFDLNPRLLMKNSESIVSSTQDLRNTNLRYFVLILAVSLNLGNFYVYDNPAALQTKLQTVRNT